MTTMSKGLLKIYLMSVSTPLITTTTPVTTSTVGDLRGEDDKESGGKKTVGNTFLNKLYSNQLNNLDVSWKKQKTLSSKRSQHSEGAEIEITDHYKNKLELISRVNERRSNAVSLYGKNFQDSIKIFKTGESPAWGGGRIHCLDALFNMNTNNTTDCPKDLLYTPE